MTPLHIELHLRIAGVLLLLLALLNIFLPRHFAWPAELQRLTLFTRQVFLAHLVFIILVLALMGLLCLCFAPSLVDHSLLATALLAGLAIFWTLRLAMQFLFYSPKLWRGQPFNTAMHILFSCLWIYFSAVFITAWAISVH